MVDVSAAVDGKAPVADRVVSAGGTEGREAVVDTERGTEVDEVHVKALLVLREVRTTPEASPLKRHR